MGCLEVSLRASCWAAASSSVTTAVMTMFLCLVKANLIENLLRQHEVMSLFP